MSIIKFIANSGKINVPLVVFQGESNSAGYALDASATSEELTERSIVQIINNTSLLFESLNIGTNNMIDQNMPAEATHGWELQLANRIADGDLPSPVYLAKCGQGGSKIADWSVGGTYWNKMIARVDAAKEQIESSNKVADIYWFYSQGINDIIAGTNEATWKTATKNHIQAVRDLYGASIPVFIVKMMNNSNNVYNDSIDAIASEMDSVFAIDVTGATLRDVNHWDYAGMKQISDDIIDTMLSNYNV